MGNKKKHRRQKAKARAAKLQSVPNEPQPPTPTQPKGADMDLSEWLKSRDERIRNGKARIQREKAAKDAAKRKEDAQNVVNRYVNSSTTTPPASAPPAHPAHPVGQMKSFLGAANVTAGRHLPVVEEPPQNSADPEPQGEGNPYEGMDEEQMLTMYGWGGYL